MYPSKVVRDCLDSSPVNSNEVTEIGWQNIFLFLHLLPYSEFGPWRPQANGSIAPNPYSWSSVTSLVFLEQPAGVGFSYNTDSSYKSWNDFRAATDNLLILKAFFQRFPEQVTSSGFYIASESYGGHYMPQLTLQIFNDEELNSRFRGMLVGNPFTSFASGSIATANILWGLQLIPQPLWWERRLVLLYCFSLIKNFLLLFSQGFF